jgi:hypothetical protein
MSDVPPKPIFRWSFSQWESYQQCPARWNYQSRLKLPRTPPGPAAARGLRIHDGVEKYIINESDELPPEVAKRYIPIIEEFKHHENGDRHVEKKLAFDNDWSICSPRDPNASCIGVLDAVRLCNDNVLHIAEWKSGKPKDTHGDQRKLYATFGLVHWRAPEVRVTTYYLEDTAPPAQLYVKESALPKLTELWGTRRDLMERDQICAARPGYYCSWCDYSAAKGGPCPFGR